MTPPCAAPKFGSVWERLADIVNTLLGTLGLSEAVTDNASVNIIPLQVGGLVGGWWVEMMCGVVYAAQVAS